MRRFGNQDVESFGVLFTPDEAETPILADNVRKALMDWLEEMWAEKQLKEVKLKPRKKAIFTGLPGTGKTTLAHHLCARLGLPMLAVKSDAIVASYVGESAKNMGGLFDAIDAYVEDHGQLGVFMDEFDTIGAKRNTEMGGRNQGSHMQHNGMVNTLLQRMEQYDGILIAATNHGEVIDQAVWRRFQIQIELGIPGVKELIRIIRRYLKPFVLPEQCERQFAEAFHNASPALVREVCESIKRNIVVGPIADWDLTKEATIDRIITSAEPHPDFGKPRLWSHKTDDISIKNMPWPLKQSLEEYGQPVTEPTAQAATDADAGGEVVSVDFGKRG